MYRAREGGGGETREGGTKLVTATNKNETASLKTKEPRPVEDYS